VKRTLLVLTSAAVIAGTGLATAGTASAAGENWPTYRQGAGGTDVRTVQSLLRFHHYGDKGDSGLKVDGSFGSATTAAVKAFQRDHRLTADGVVGKGTWSALVVRTARPAGGEQVLALQDQLRSVGAKVPRTASFDAATQSAVKDAQRRYGLKADGIANADTWKALVAHSR
jgi:peptidoglycan hydrolase-like protein with peptidoglycan-binding domain